MLYQILEKTPFSIKYFPSEPFRPIAEWAIQEAEYNLKLNKTHYYEHAVIVGDRFGYPREIAERIAEYWRTRWSFADYQLCEVESTPNTACSGRACGCGKFTWRGETEFIHDPSCSEHSPAANASR